MPLPRLTTSWRRPWYLLPCTLALALPVACAASGKPMPQIAAEINATLDPQPARFFAGDSVGLRFAHDTNLDQTVRVDSNGNASFLLIGTLNVAGKRPDEVRAELERAYSAKLTAPDLSVNLLEFIPTADVNSTNRAIHVLGEVRNPGQISFMGQRVTLIDALAKTGGFLKATALLQNVLLVRWMPEQHCYRAWRIDASTKLWGAADQILLQSNDIVFVPNTPIDDVDIWVDQYIRLLIPFPFLLAPAPR